MKKSLMDRIPRKGMLVIILLTGIVLALWASTAASAPHLEGPPFHYANGRFGFGWTRKVTNAELVRDWAAYLNAGWYWDWSARGATELPPLQYVQTVRLKPVLSSGVQIGYTATPTGTTLLTAISRQPGATWYIGNEPDCNMMDNMRSEWYARAYYDLYHLIKAADPTAKIAAGNIVQPTPQRLMYLDRVLAEYQTRYGEPLPTDVWSIHNYILCEKCYPYNIPSEPFAWGACWVPDWPSRAASQSIATFHSVYDHWDIDIYTTRIETFRQWMYDNGYHNHPLVIPEYGVLFYDGLVYSGATYDAKSREFMYLGFDWMQNARNPLTGYRPDDDRLTQGWAWFSLDHGSYPGGTLFNPNTHQPTTMGRDYAAYTAQVTPTIDVLVLDAHVTVPGESGTRALEAGTLVTATANFTVSNAGNIGTTEPIVAKMIGNSPVSPTQYSVIGGMTIDHLRCCGDHEIVTLPWPNYIAGEAYDFYATNRETDLNVHHLWTTEFSDTVIITPVTFTLYATVSNMGYMDIEEPLTVTFYHNTSVPTTIGQVVIPDPGCCSNQYTVSVIWPDLSDGYYPFCVTAATADSETELLCSSLWINPRKYYFPIILSQ